MAITCVGTLSGGNPRIGKFTVKASEILSIGVMCSLDTNEVDAFATNDTAMVGIALEAVDNTVDGHTIRCIISPDAVYAYRDGTAHAAGATLDLATGGLALAASSNADVTVIADNAATEDTLFIITPGEHYLHLGG